MKIELDGRDTLENMAMSGGHRRGTLLTSNYQISRATRAAVAILLLSVRNQRADPLPGSRCETSKSYSS